MSIAKWGMESDYISGIDNRRDRYTRQVRCGGCVRYSAKRTLIGALVMVVVRGLRRGLLRVVGLLATSERILVPGMILLFARQ